MAYQEFKLRKEKGRKQAETTQTIAGIELEQFVLQEWTQYIKIC